MSLAVFQIQQKDRAQQDPDWPCVGNNCYYIAGGEAQPRRRGRGLGPHHAGLDPVRRLHLQHQQIPEGRDGRRSAYASFTPRHIFRLWTRYALPVMDRRLSVGGGLRMQSGYSTVSGPVTLRQGGYSLVDLRMAYRLDKHVTAALNVNNLFDRRYYQSLSGVSWNNRYGEPRSLMLTLSAQY